MAYLTIDIDDIFQSFSSFELSELADELYEAGYLPKELEKMENEKKLSSLEEEWVSLVEKLKSIRLFISSEDETQIRNILEKY